MTKIIAPHLTVYQPQSGSVASVLNRFAGVTVFLGLLLLPTYLMGPLGGGPLGLLTTPEFPTVPIFENGEIIAAVVTCELSGRDQMVHVEHEGSIAVSDLYLNLFPESLLSLGAIGMGISSVLGYILTTPLIVNVLAGMVTWALLYHVAAGIRHFFSDDTHLMNYEDTSFTGYLAIAGSLGITTYIFMY